MRKKVNKKLPFFVVALIVAIVITAVLMGYSNNKNSENGKILLGNRPQNLIKTDDWLAFNTDAPFTFSYPTTWGIEATAAEDDKRGVHVVGPEGEVFMYWGSGFGGGCEPSSMVDIKLKDESLKVCDEKNNDGGESWRLISKQISSEVGFDARALANVPADKNREVILAILSTLSFKK